MLEKSSVKKKPLKKIKEIVEKRVEAGKENINKRTEIFLNKILDFGNMVFGGIVLSQLFSGDFSFSIVALGFFVCGFTYYYVYSVLR